MSGQDFLSVCVYRQYYHVIRLRLWTWGRKSQGLAWGTKDQNINSSLWCSQQQIRGFPLTRLKQLKQQVFSLTLYSKQLVYILGDNVFCLVYLCSIFYFNGWKSAIVLKCLLFELVWSMEFLWNSDVSIKMKRVGTLQLTEFVHLNYLITLSTRIIFLCFFQWRKLW